MKSLASVLVGVTAIVTLAGTVHAQMIEFGSPQFITGPSDLITDGTYVDALQTFNASSAISVLNPTTNISTTFNVYTTSGSVTNPPAGTPSNYYADGTFSITADGDSGGDGSGSNATPYQAVLDGSTYTNYPAQTPTEVGTVTISGLTPGDVYQVQAFAAAGFRNVTYASADSENLNYYTNTNTGQYVIGTFTAPLAPVGSTTSSEYFTYQNTYPIDVSAGEIDGIVLREVPEPSTYAMMLGGLALLAFALRRKPTAQFSR